SRASSCRSTRSSSTRSWGTAPVRSSSGPLATTRPWLTIATRWQTAPTPVGTWEWSNTVPPPAASSRTSSRTSRRPTGSRAEVGSSSSTRGGRGSRARAGRRGGGRALGAALGVAPHPLAPPPGQADPLQQLGDALGPLPGANAGQAAVEVEQLGPGGPLREPEGLGEVADPAAGG